MRLRLLILPLLLTACMDTPGATYGNKGDPEQQLVTTTESVVFELSEPGALERLKEALSLDRPQLAQAACDPKDGTCVKAKKSLMKAGIPVEISSSGNNVTLHYERQAAIACDQRYADNSKNSANKTMPQLGCSIRSNMLQMVTDKQQFVNPGLLDYQDGEKAAQNYQRYLAPPAETQPANGGESLIGTATVE